MYQHTQRSPASWVLFLLPATAFFLAWYLRQDPYMTLTMLVVGIVGCAVAFSIQTLTVADGGDHLSVRYGPLPLFGTSIPYRDIDSVEKSRSSLIDGLGIHYVPGRGWTLNLWGFECVKVVRGNKVLRVGSDDSENLVRFIDSRLSAK